MSQSAFQRGLVSFVVIVFWNSLMYLAKTTNASLIAVLGYGYVVTLIALKTTTLAGRFSQMIQKIDAEKVYEKINEYCGKVHRQMHGWRIIVLAWVGVKLAIYGRILGTFGFVWVAVNFVLLGKVVKDCTGVELLASVLSLRSKMIAALIKGFKRLCSTVCSDKPKPIPA